MPPYNVHLYREMRLFFPGIEADTPEQEAKIAADKPMESVSDVDDCEGDNLYAVVDLVGDTDYNESVTIDLAPMRHAAQELYEACELAFKRSCERADSRVKWTSRDQRAHEALKAALVKARGETLPEAA